MIKRTTFLIFLFLQALVFAQKKEINALEILSKADSVCKALKHIQYEVTIETTASQIITANIIQAKEKVKDVGFGASKILVEGKITTPRETKAFKFSYDGQNFKFLEGKKQVMTIENPNPKVVGRTLGFNYYMVVTQQFGKPDGFGSIIKRMSNAELLGIVKLQKSESYHILITNSFTNPATKEIINSESEWFFDKETFLPIKVVLGKGSMIKTTNILKKDKPDQIVFDINPSSNLDEMLITGNEANTEGLLKNGEVFPKFSLKDFEGNLIDNTIFKKYQLTIIDFWGTWCGPCLMAMPKLQELYNNFNDKGINIIGISVSDKPGKPEKLVAKRGYTYDFLLDGDDLAKTLKLNTYPTIFVINKQGQVIHAEKGTRDVAHNYLESIIKDTIENK